MKIFLSKSTLNNTIGKKWFEKLSNLKCPSNKEPNNISILDPNFSKHFWKHDEKQKKNYKTDSYKFYD